MRLSALCLTTLSLRMRAKGGKTEKRENATFEIYSAVDILRRWNKKLSIAKYAKARLTKGARHAARMPCGLPNLRGGPTGAAAREKTRSRADNVN